MPGGQDKATRDQRAAAACRTILIQDGHAPKIAAGRRTPSANYAVRQSLFMLERSFIPLVDLISLEAVRFWLKKWKGLLSCSVGGSLLVWSNINRRQIGPRRRVQRIDILRGIKPFCSENRKLVY